MHAGRTTGRRLARPREFPPGSGWIRHRETGENCPEEPRVAPRLEVQIVHECPVDVTRTDPLSSASVEGVARRWCGGEAETSEAKGCLGARTACMRTRPRCWPVARSLRAPRSPPEVKLLPPADDTDTPQPPDVLIDGHPIAGGVVGVGSTQRSLTSRPRLCRPTNKANETTRKCLGFGSGSRPNVRMLRNRYHK